MRVGALTFCLIVSPLAIVDVSICMNQLPASICLIVTPHSFIARRVRPHLHSISVSALAQPLAFVNSSVWKRLGSFLHAAFVIRFTLSLAVVSHFQVLLFGSEGWASKIVRMLCCHCVGSSWRIIKLVFEVTVSIADGATFCSHVLLVEALAHLMLIRVTSCAFSFA